jgi:hypothetical protein
VKILLREKNGGTIRSDLSVASPPCTSCRHADICDLPPTCHALRYFESTGKRITPPRIFPGKREQELAPAPVPRPRRVDGLTDAEAEALAQFQRDMSRRNE